MKTNHFFIFILSLIGTLGYSQQDSQYTQYMYNTTSVNPAYAGTRDALSVFGLYRAQWVGLEGAPDTGVFSIHSPVGERVGLGLSFVNDRIGIAEESSISVDFSYKFPVSENFNLSFGLKATANMMDVNFSKLNTVSNTVFENNIENKFSPNIGAGVYLYSDKFYAGFSVPNFLETKYYDDNNRTTVSERIHGYFITGYVFDFSDNLKFKPAALAKAVNGAPLQVDVTGNFLLYEKLTLGAAWRWDAAFSVLAGFQITDGLFIGYAYDAETTKLANYNSGSHEIFLRYEFVKKKSKERVLSPRFF